MLNERDIQRGLDALEEGVLQLKRIANMLEVAASNQFGHVLDRPCKTCGCKFMSAGAETCPVCGTATPGLRDD